MAKLIGTLLLGTFFIAALSCKKDKKTTSANSQSAVVFNHTVEMSINGSYFFSDGIHLNHFEETNKIDFYSLPGDRFIEVRMADTLEAGQSYPILQDPNSSQVYIYYSPDPDSSGYIALPGSSMHIIEHNTETKQIKAVFNASMQSLSGSGNIVVINNGKIKINY